MNRRGFLKAALAGTLTAYLGELPKKIEDKVKTYKRGSLRLTVGGWMLGVDHGSPDGMKTVVMHHGEDGVWRIDGADRENQAKMQQALEMAYRDGALNRVHIRLETP